MVYTTDGVDNDRLSDSGALLNVLLIGAETVILGYCYVAKLLSG